MEIKPDLEVEAKVACPTCYAPKGQRCRLAHTAQFFGWAAAGGLETEGTHNRRYEAAKAEADHAGA